MRQLTREEKELIGKKLNEATFPLSNFNIQRSGGQTVSLYDAVEEAMREVLEESAHRANVRVLFDDLLGVKALYMAMKVRPDGQTHVEIAGHDRRIEIVIPERGTARARGTELLYDELDKLALRINDDKTGRRFYKPGCRFRSLSDAGVVNPNTQWIITANVRTKTISLTGNIHGWSYIGSEVSVLNPNQITEEELTQAMGGHRSKFELLLE